MIEVTIKQAAKRRGFHTASQFSESIGYKRSVGTRIWNATQPPKLQTLDRICQAWRCGLDELIKLKLEKPKPNGNARKPKAVGRRKG